MLIEWSTVDSHHWNILPLCVCVCVCVQFWVCATTDPGATITVRANEYCD